MDRDPFDLVGDVLDGQFRVEAFAGEGDLSVVYKGHHVGVDAPVAIKCLNLPETLDASLARPLVAGFNEASRIHYRLARGNLHIAQTIASGSTLVPRTGTIVPYLVREWFEGESLASELRRRREEKRTGRPLDEALALLETAFDGISYAHEQGDVHLSINPSNLFVVQRKGKALGPSLKVLDFGVARTMNEFGGGLSTTSRSGGGLRLLFPAYAAPEQLDRAVGELGPWTDVYALALLMMEVLSDRTVMSEPETGAVVDRALDDERRPTPRSHELNLPASVDRALTRAVSRLPARRQTNAAELWRDLKASDKTSVSMAVPAPPALGSLPPIPSLRSLPPPPPSLRPRAQTLVGMSAPVAMAAGAVGHRFGQASATAVTMRPAPYEVLLPSPPAPQHRRLDVPAAPPAASAPEPTETVVAIEKPPPHAGPMHVTELFSPLASMSWTSRALCIAGAFAWTSVFALCLVPAAMSMLRPAESRAVAHVATAAHATVVGSGAALASATAPAAASATATVPATSSESAHATASTTAPAGSFSPPAAKRALDRTWREVGRCRRGKSFGNATATVTFACDGTVDHVDVGPPFTGTPTGDCAITALTAAHVAPFAAGEKADPTAVVSYRFYVAPR
jgi:serine/threonine protein kinase